MFSGCIVQHDSNETKLGSSDREACPSAGKNTRVVLVPCRAWKCVPGYFRGPWVSFATTDEFSMRVTKITSLVGVS